MARLFFRPAAEADLAAIGEYTRSQRGAEQALSYVSEIEACCQMAADRPELVRALVATEYRRIEQGSHAVFYRRTDAGDVLVVRFLHQRMDPDRHLANVE